MNHAPMSPKGTARASAISPNNATIRPYCRNTSLRRPPSAFSTPIMGTCWATTADITFVTRKALSNKVSPPRIPIISNPVSTLPCMMWTLGSGISARVTTTPSCSSHPVTAVTAVSTAARSGSGALTVSCNWL